MEEYPSLETMSLIRRIEQLEQEVKNRNTFIAAICRQQQSRSLYVTDLELARIPRDLTLVEVKDMHGRTIKVVELINE